MLPRLRGRSFFLVFGRVGAIYSIQVRNFNNLNAEMNVLVLVFVIVSTPLLQARNDPPMYRIVKAAILVYFLGLLVHSFVLADALVTEDVSDTNHCFV